MKHLETSKSWTEREIFCENMLIYQKDGLVFVCCKGNECKDEKKAREIGCLKPKP